MSFSPSLNTSLLVVLWIILCIPLVVVVVVVVLDSLLSIVSYLISERNSNGCSQLIPSLVIQEIVDIPETKEWHDEDADAWDREPEEAEEDDQVLDDQSSNWVQQVLTKIESIWILEKHDESGVDNHREVVRSQKDCQWRID